MSSPQSQFPDAELDELIEFLRFAHLREPQSYKGHVCFKVKYPSGQVNCRHLKVHPEQGVNVGEEGRSEPTLECIADRQTFFEVYMAKIHPRSAILTGRLHVKNFKYGDLSRFGASFDMTPEKWQQYYDYKRRKAVAVIPRSSFEADQQRQHNDNDNNDELLQEIETHRGGSDQGRSHLDFVFSWGRPVERDSEQHMSLPVTSPATNTHGFGLISPFWYNPQSVSCESDTNKKVSNLPPYPAAQTSLSLHPLLYYQSQKMMLRQRQQQFEQQRQQELQQQQQEQQEEEEFYANSFPPALLVDDEIADKTTSRKVHTTTLPMDELEDHIVIPPPPPPSRAPFHNSPRHHEKGPQGAICRQLWSRGLNKTAKRLNNIIIASKTREKPSSHPHPVPKDAFDLCTW